MSRISALRSPPAGTVDVVVVGAGHSGLAMSHRLAQHSIDHVVLERGEVANAWRRERWDSLRLLTPNWQARLPGYAYAGHDPDGYMGTAEVAAWIERYSAVIGAPVRTETCVTSVSERSREYSVGTSRGVWRCRAVVLASGAHNVPVVPAAAASLPCSVRALTAREYREPNALDPGGVLVVGGSATGLQIAEEIHASGRRVTLAVGAHVRMPRIYRGRDIQWWLDVAGILDERYDEVDDIARARRVPSPQLIGSPEQRTLDLNTLAEHGVEIVGRLAAIADGKALFSGALRNDCKLADLKLLRLLERLDQWSREHRCDADVGAPERFASTRIPQRPRLALDFARERIATVVWATGFRPDYGWLNVPACDRKGRLLHDGGVVSVPGLYALGLPFMRRRKSSFIHGAADDTRDLAEHLAHYLRSKHSGSLRAAG